MVFPAFASWELTRNSGKASITNMSSDSKPQMELKADVKRWLKARGLDYKWLAEQCFVSEVTVYNWMAKKKIPEVKEHIIRSLMTEMPVTSVREGGNGVPRDPSTAAGCPGGSGAQGPRQQDDADRFSGDKNQ